MACRNSECQVFLPCTYETRHAKVTFLHYMFVIIRLYLYAYFFIIISLITGLLSVCAAVISALVHHPISMFSFVTSHEVAIASDSIIVNFVSLTLYAQATVFFLVPFGKFILCFGQNHAFHVLELTGSKLRIQSFTSRVFNLFSFAIYCIIFIKSKQ